MNANGMPPNYEVLLGRWRANATAAVEYLTDFRYRDQCPSQGPPGVPHLLPAIQKTPPPPPHRPRSLLVGGRFAVCFFQSGN